MLFYALMSLCIEASEENKTVSSSIKVCIHVSATHVALEATIQGIKDTLAAAGYTEGQSLEIFVESAQSNAVIASQISSKFVHKQPDLVFAVGTLSAQSMMKHLQPAHIKMIFASVTDPVGAGIVGELQCHSNWVSGVSNLLPLAPQLKVIQDVQPHIQKLGIIYNAGESNSVKIVHALREVCQKYGVQLIEQTVTKTSEIAQAASSLARKVEAILVSNDNTCLSGFQSIVKAALDMKIPVYCSDTDQVKNGALAALGPNQYAIGQQAGEMGLRVLKGASLDQIPVEFPKTIELYLNDFMAQKLNITFPARLINKAVVRINGE